MTDHDRQVWTFVGPELGRLRREIEGAAHTVRFAVDEGKLKVKADEGMWSPGLGPTPPEHTGEATGEPTGGSVVITGAANIRWAQVLTMAHALALEINTGMSHSRGSVLAEAQRQGLTTKRTKKGALADIVAKLKEASPSFEPGASITRALGKR